MIDERFRADISDALGELPELFVKAGHRVCLVGGLVRDAMLGIDGSADIDLTTDATPDETLEIVEPWADSVWEQGKQFGTIGAQRATPRTGTTTVEITTHRAESYNPDSRKPQVRYSRSIETDLSRRDFTVNAMAVELPSWELIDPHGGTDDLRDRILRTPSPPSELFDDDPLRMLRAARFISQIGLTPVRELTAAVKKMSSRIAIVSRERISAEIEKLLSLDRPSDGVQFMIDTGLDEAVIGMSLKPTKKTTSATAKKRTENLPEVLDRTRADVEVRLSAMFTWLGVDEDAASKIVRALRFPATVDVAIKRMLRALSVLDGWAETATDMPIEDRRRFVADHLNELQDAVAVHDAVRSYNKPAKGKTAGNAALSEQLLSLAQTEGTSLTNPPLDGNEVMSVTGLEGPVIGEAMTALRTEQFHQGPMTAAAARRFVKQWAARRT